MRRSKSYEVRDPMNIWNKYDLLCQVSERKAKSWQK